MPHADARAIFKKTIGLTTLALAALAPPAAASAGGGVGYPGAPQIESIECTSSDQQLCPSKRTLVRGAQARVRGLRLGVGREVVFKGARGRRDDVAARPSHRASRHLDLLVPSGARSGPVAVLDRFGRAVASAKRVRVAEPAPVDVAPGGAFFFDGRRKPAFAFTAARAGTVQLQVVRASDGAVVTTMEVEAQAGDNSATWNGKIGSRPAPDGNYTFRLADSAASAATPAGTDTSFTLRQHLFPIRGRHNLGYTRTNQFGGGRGHQGIDMFARCGVKLAAARGGRVQYAGYHARAGNYVVIDGAGTGVDYTYMHMNTRPLVRTGQRVFTGQKLGEIGDSGNADGCHLHFEMWSAPGWYEGGSPLDPLPQLKRWDAYS